MQPKWQFRLLVSLASITAGLSALRVAFSFGYNYGVFRAVDGVHSTCCLTFLDSFVVPITIALILAVVGMWSRKRIGLFVSFAALLFIPVIYVYWYLGTLSIMRKAEISSFDQMPNQSQYLLSLANATWWDVYVLFVVIVLIIWQLIMVRRRHLYPADIADIKEASVGSQMVDWRFIGLTLFGGVILAFLSLFDGVSQFRAVRILGGAAVVGACVAYTVLMKGNNFDQFRRAPVAAALVGIVATVLYFLATVGMLSVKDSMEVIVSQTSSLLMLKLAVLLSLFSAAGGLIVTAILKGLKDASSKAAR